MREKGLEAQKGTGCMADAESVAAEMDPANDMSDEEILREASRIDELSYDCEIGSCGGFSCGDNPPSPSNVSSILRDYVRLRTLRNRIRDRISKVDTDFDPMYYLEMMTPEDWKSIEDLYDGVKDIKNMFEEPVSESE